MDADTHKKESTAYIPSGTSAMPRADDDVREIYPSPFCPSVSSQVHRPMSLVENPYHQNGVKPIDIAHQPSQDDTSDISPTEISHVPSHLNDNVQNSDRHCAEGNHTAHDLSKACEMCYHPSNGRLPVKQNVRNASTPESRLGSLRTNLVDSFWSSSDLERSDQADHRWHTDKRSFPSKEKTRWSRSGSADNLQTFQEPQSYNNSMYGSTTKRNQIPTSQNTQDSSSEPQKEKKSISTKTFASGMMDVSLLTNTATHLRTVLANPGHDFYALLLYLILTSIALQIVSSILRITADFCKTQVKEKDLLTQGRRKLLNFLALILVMIVTSLNILISVFSTPVGMPAETSSDKVPMFSSANYMGDQSSHSEL